MVTVITQLNPRGSLEDQLSKQLSRTLLTGEGEEGGVRVMRSFTFPFNIDLLFTNLCLAVLVAKP